MEISCLPEELLEYIFSYLSAVSELQTASQVCQLWREICLPICKHRHSIFVEEAQKGNFVWQCAASIDQSLAMECRISADDLKLSKSTGHSQNLSTLGDKKIHQAQFYGQKIYICGWSYCSSNSGDDSYQLYQDIFSYNVTDRKWETCLDCELQGGSQLAQFGRLAGYNLTRFEDNLILIGGYDTRTKLENMKVLFFNISLGLWYGVGNYLHLQNYNATCLGDSGFLKLILINGSPQNYMLVPHLSIKVLKMQKRNYTYVLADSKSWTIETIYLRKWHAQTKIDEQTILIYGGFTSEEFEYSSVRNDAGLITFNVSFTDAQFTNVTVKDVGIYGGLYPAFVDNPVRVGNSLIFIQKAIYLFETSDPILRGWDFDPLFDDSNRVQTHKNDCYTFILNFDHVQEKGEISWKPVTKNPVLRTSFEPIIQVSILAGDAIYLFNGSSSSCSSNPFQFSVTEESA